MRDDKEILTYKRNLSKDEMSRITKAVVIPLALFAYAMFATNALGGFGSKLVCPLTALVWLFSVIVAFKIPAIRKDTINETYIFIVSYLTSLLAFRFLLELVSGVSAEMISASLNQALPTSTGNAIPGWIQNLMFFGGAMSPAGFAAMQGKKILNFRKNADLEKSLQKARGVRRNPIEGTERR